MQNSEIKVFRKTTKQVIQELESIKDIDVVSFENSVVDAFDNYNVEGVEELVGFDSWGELKNGNDYILNIKIDHKDAYEFSLYITIKDNKISVTNVL